MKLHIITVGEPKLAYAATGWQEYTGRLRHYHTLRVTHLPDKYAFNASGAQSMHSGQAATAVLRAAGSGSYKIALAIKGRQFSSPELAAFIEQRNQDGREVACIIGGPDGLPPEVLQACDLQWSFGHLTYPHDLAMVILAESLYRSSTIVAGQPYHR